MFLSLYNTKIPSRGDPALETRASSKQGIDSEDRDVYKSGKIEVADTKRLK